MSDDTPARLPITDPHKVEYAFVNDVAGIGFLNGVLNVTFTQARWTPNQMGQENIPPDLIVAARLRMDLMCAQVLRDQLSKIIEAETRRPALNG
jgi:hypothetical protein